MSTECAALAKAISIAIKAAGTASEAHCTAELLIGDTCKGTRTSITSQRARPRTDYSEEDMVIYWNYVYPLLEIRWNFVYSSVIGFVGTYIFVLKQSVITFSFSFLKNELRSNVEKCLNQKIEKDANVEYLQAIEKSLHGLIHYSYSFPNRLEAEKIFLDLVSDRIVDLISP